MANGNGDGQHFDRPAVQPAVLTNTDHDPWHGDRLPAATMEKVQFVNQLGWPNCGDLNMTIDQMKKPGPDLIGRMDHFIGGTFKQNGFTMDDLRKMENSPQFSREDKVGISVLMNGFSKATDTNVANPHMTGQQLFKFIVNAAVLANKKGCHIEGT